MKEGNNSVTLLNNTISLDILTNLRDSYPYSVILDTCSLPSTQGWAYYGLGGSGSEGDVFSIQDCKLHQNSMGQGFQGQGSNYYRLDNVVDPTKPFVMKVRARVIQEEMASAPNYNNHYGFCFSVSTGEEAFSIGLGTQTIMALDNDEANRVLSTSVDNTEFHDYRLEGTPGVGYKLYVDDALIATGATKIMPGTNSIGFGDGTGGCNAEAVIASLEFSQEKTTPVAVDIKPGSCPNSFNSKSKGNLPVAILGTADFNVMDIDLNSVSLTKDGVADAAFPTKWSYEDVATPFVGSPCDCNDLNGDGYTDLVLHFDTQTLVDKLKLNDNRGQIIPLQIKGKLKGEDKSIEGQDCLRVLK